MKKIITVAMMVLALAGSLILATPAATVAAKDYCGDEEHSQVKTSIDIGCDGKGEPFTDMAFAIIRFLGAGVGLVVVGSIVYGGLQYIGSRGDPNSTAMAMERIRNSVIALLIFIFAYAILGYLIPKGFIFK